MNLHLRRVHPTLWLPLLLALLVALLGPSPSASAWSYDAVSPIGPVGELEVTGPMIAAVGSKPLTFESGALTVHASPAAAGGQTVYAQVELERFDFGVWRDIAHTDVLVGHVSSGKTWTIGSWRASVPKLFPMAVYRISYTVQWSDDATSSAIAAARIVPTTYADASCLAAGCDSTKGGVIM